MRYDGVDPIELGARLRCPGWVVLERVTSTLDVMHELAHDGAPERTVVLAEEQVRGRGRHGRVWKSPRGSGIWLAYLLRPRRADATAVASLRVGLAVGAALEELGIHARIKWPNDVMVGGRKLCGILCENRWNGSEMAWMAVGIGINVHGPVAPDLADVAIAADACAPSITRIRILEALLPRLHGLASAPELSGDELVDFAARDALAGRPIVEPVVGTVAGIDAAGALLVRGPAGTERITGGHVVTA